MEPFDFVVRGTPRTPKSKSKATWQDVVRSAATSAWPRGRDFLQGELSAQIVHFFTDSTDLDIDNIIKPILDSLEGLVFENDRTIFEVTARRTRQASELTIKEAPLCLIEALVVEPEFVFVRVGRGPDHRELPW
jgi:crossover junction endodeoxyribonuclease RusA